MDYSKLQNLPLLFFERAAHYGEAPFLWRKQDGAWHSMSWRAVAESASKLSRGLRAQGLQRGDRVGLVAENRPEWLIADLAIMAAGGVTVPAYTTNTVKDHVHILSDSGAKTVIVSTAKLAERVLPAAIQSGCDRMITLEPFCRHTRTGCPRRRVGGCDGQRSGTGRRRDRRGRPCATKRHLLHNLYVRHGRRTARRNAESRRNDLQRHGSA